MRPVALFAAILLLLPSAGAKAAQLSISAQGAAVHSTGGPYPGDCWNLWSNGYIAQPIRVLIPGNYSIQVRAWGSPAGRVWPEMSLLVDGLGTSVVRVGTAERRDYSFAVSLTAGVHEIGVAFLNDMMLGNEDRNLYLERIVIVSPASGIACQTVSTTVANVAGSVRERQTLVATTAAIDRNRKGAAVVRVVSAAGREVPAARVTVEQTGHEFLFGGNIFMFDRLPTSAQNAAYKQSFQDLFNYATLGFYWRSYEPQRGKPDYPGTDRVAAWCRQRSIRMKGHPLLWADEAGVPVWSQGLPAADVQRRRVDDILARYRDRIEFWEVVNEPSHLTSLKIDDPYRWARQAAPFGKLIVNDYNVMADGAPAFFQLLSDAKRNGVPFDAVGIQAHEPQTMRFPLDRVQRILDRYASLNVGLHITEFTPTSSGQPVTGWYGSGKWDEQTQAEYAEQFYQVCFAHPAVEAITWWDLCDSGAWLRGGGLLRADLTPKPARDRLYDLIQRKWKTRLTGYSDAQGRYSFRGFYGAYRVTAVAPTGATAVRTFRLKKGDPPPTWTVTLGAAP